MHVSSLLANGNIVLLGGQQDSVWNNTSEIYDAVSQQFLTGANMELHTPRCECRDPECRG